MTKKSLTTPDVHSTVNICGYAKFHGEIMENTAYNRNKILLHLNKKSRSVAVLFNYTCNIYNDICNTYIDIELCTRVCVCGIAEKSPEKMGLEKNSIGKVPELKSTNKSSH